MEIIVSNLLGSGNNTDPNLINPRAILKVCSKIWVAVYGKSQVVIYSKCGKVEKTISVPSPVGLAHWKMNKEKVILVSSENGNVYGLTKSGNPSNNTTNPTTVISGVGTLGGIATTKCNIYLAVIGSQQVNIYNNSLTLEKVIKDSDLAKFSYTPVALYAKEHKIFILYTNLSSITIGNGYVNSYNAKKGTLKRKVNRSNLWTPTSVVATESFILVGNAGSGLISIFDKKNGQLCDVKNDYVQDGTSGFYLEDSLLYFTAANDSGKMGTVGYVSV